MSEKHAHEHLTSRYARGGDSRDSDAELAGHVWHALDDQSEVGSAGVDAVVPDDLTAALRLIPGVRRRVDIQERDLMAAWLDAGGTWASLAAELGESSGDAVRQRYRRLGGTRTWPAGRPPAADENVVRLKGTGHTAQYRPHAAADGAGAWEVTWVPGRRLFDRNQAITALQLARLVESGKHTTGPGPGLLRTWCQELQVDPDRALTALTSEKDQ